MDATAGTSLAHPGGTGEGSGRPSDVPRPNMSPAGHGEGAEHWFWSARFRLWVSIASGVLLLVGAVGLWTLEGSETRWLGGLVWLSLLGTLVYACRAAYESISEGAVDIDVLMVVGAGLAAWIGHPGEGALLLFLFVLSGALEELATARTTREISALHQLMPTACLVERDGAWVDVPPETVVVGDRVRVRPGDRVPTDAKVVEGISSLDQSTLTGESLPRTVGVGDEVFAGTVNISGALVCRVTRPASESSLQRVLNLVMQAREQREPVQQFIDTISQPYAYGVMITSAVVFVVWWLWLGVPPAKAAYTAITFLIVLSPCAIIIATPTATLSAIARGARAGVLFKGGQSLERLARVGAVCFDKTGTLTFGRPQLVEVVPIGWSDRDRLLAVAAALEADSTHPIAKAVREAAIARGVGPAPVQTMEHSAGAGVTGTFESDAVVVGSYEFSESVIPECLRARTREVVAQAQDRGQITAVVAAGGGHGASAVLVIADQVRPGAQRAIADFHALGIRPVRMLTGDHPTPAGQVAERLRLDGFEAALRPEDKVHHIGALKQGMPGSSSRRAVAFVGDGVNDAPALAAADVSIAIGSIGSDAALESADIVLMSDDLRVVPWAIELARRARETIRANFTLALSIIGLMAIATLVGSRIGAQVPMALGVVAHEGGTLLVVVNSLRLLGFRGPSAAPAIAAVGSPANEA